MQIASQANNFLDMTVTGAHLPTLYHCKLRDVHGVHKVESTMAQLYNLLFDLCKCLQTEC